MPAMKTARPKITPRLCDALEALYLRYNRPEYIHPDPLSPVLRYEHSADQEIAGLVAASLAFGNVKTIVASVERVLDTLASPHANLMTATRPQLTKRFKTFRHRYVTGREVTDLLMGMQHVLQAYGTLGQAFQQAIDPDDDDIVPALGRWRGLLREGGRLEKNYLLPDPARGSACKRLFMYLRWMVRKDGVDPGPWTFIDPAQLLYPMDTHMLRIAGLLGFTHRTTADLRTAREVTVHFARIVPHDPVRYDFALTRLGIRDDTDLDAFMREV
jgi:uncharacterized protein (TIGR02757 family)